MTSTTSSHSVFKPSLFSAARLNVLSVLLASACLSACSSTNNAQTPVVDAQCQQYALNMAEHAEQSGASAQHVSAARALQQCVALPLPLNVTDSEERAAMQLMAMTTLTYIKGGDVSSAMGQLASFKRTFPEQDLLLTDYTSFTDTATALLNGKTLSTQELAELNISRELRSELSRQHYWLNH